MLLAVVVGAELAGLWGVFLAIPLAGIVQYGVKRWLAPKIYGQRGALPVSASGVDGPPDGAAPPP